MAFQFNMPDFDRADLGGFGKPKIHPTSGAIWDPVRGIWMSPPNSEQRVDPTTGWPIAKTFEGTKEEFEGGMLSPEVDPVQAAVDQATGGVTIQDIATYLGGDQADVYNEQYDFNKDGVVDTLDISALGRSEQGATAQNIATYLGGDQADVYNEWYDFNKDGVVDTLDISAAGRLEQETAQPDPVQDAVDAAVGGGGTPPQTGNKYGFIRPPPESINTQALVPYYNPTTGETFTASSGGWTAPEGWVQGNKPDDWTPPTTDPVQDAVDAATGTKPLPSSYGAVDNWGEPGYTAYDPADQFIDPVTSFVEDPVSPFMDEDPSTDTWTAPVFDVLETAGAGAGGDPRTDFAPVNNLFEPGIGDPYPLVLLTLILLPQ